MSFSEGRANPFHGGEAPPGLSLTLPESAPIMALQPMGGGMTVRGWQ